jgi:peptidoglycan/LPS O-acetylase OafA/YrhL
LTGLRFLAALPVVLFHILPRAAMPEWADRLADLGYVSVGLFFVLSGFVLAYAYSGGEGQVDARVFYRNRFARIYPVYALAMLVALPEFARTFENLQLPRQEFGLDVLLRFTLVHAWHPGTMKYYNVPSWSLSCEAFFYLLFPLLLPAVFRLAPREVPRSLVAVLALAAFAPALFAWTYPGADPSTENYRILLIKFHPLVRLPEFIAGMLLGRLFAAGRPAPSRADLWVLGGAAVVVGAILLGMPYVLLHTGGLAAAFAAAIWALAFGNGRLAGWLAGGPMVRLGEGSYALYIGHVPAFVLLRQWAASKGVPVEGMPFALGALVLLVAGSLLVYRFFELPLRRRLREPEYPDVDPKGI